MEKPGRRTALLGVVGTSTAVGIALVLGACALSPQPVRVDAGPSGVPAASAAGRTGTSVARPVNRVVFRSGDGSFHAAVQEATLGEGDLMDFDWFGPPTEPGTQTSPPCAEAVDDGHGSGCGLLDGGTVAWVVEASAEEVTSASVTVWRRTPAGAWRKVLASRPESIARARVYPVRTPEGARVAVSAVGSGGRDGYAVLLSSDGSRIDARFAMDQGGVLPAGDGLSVRFRIYRSDDLTFSSAGGDAGATVELEKGRWVYRDLRKL